MPISKDVCESCAKPGSTRANLYVCSFCNALRHTACGCIKIALEDGSSGRVCPCRPDLVDKAKSEIESKATLALAEKAKALRTTTRTKGNTDSASLPSTSVLGSDSGSATSLRATVTAEALSSSALDQLFARLDARIADLETNLERRIESKLDRIENIVKDIPALRETVKLHSSEIVDLNTKHATLREFVEGVAELHSSCDAVLEEARLVDVEKTTNELSSAVDALELNPSFSRTPLKCSHDDKTSSRLLISGLAVPEKTNLRRLAFAVLNSLIPDVEQYDILEARFLKSKQISQSTGSTNDPSNEPANPPSPSPTMENSMHTSTSTTPHTTSRNRNSNIKSTLRAPLPPLLLVTLASPQLVSTAIRAKISHGTLHTSQINTTKLMYAGINAPLPPLLINVNEFLEKDTYNLRKWVREKAKMKELGIKSFVRGGSIYVRRISSSESIKISEPADLDNFLAAPKE